MNKWKDEIVAEVRAVRDAYAQRFAYDVRAICRDLKRSQDAGNRKVVRLPAKQVPAKQVPAKQAMPKSGRAG